ncbi:MAG: DUF1846 domain-containing protein [Oscillospiraceae bacterium]|nr:DUF1846 domain-containing protein [Oscillospiraceae bacterium]
MKIGFDNEHYIEEQSHKIRERIRTAGAKLYLEFGGKLFDDYHAVRVLPGFECDSKVRILDSLKDQLEIVFCISAADIERNKIRADFGIPYHLDLLRLIDKLRGRGLTVSAVVITQYSGQPAADIFNKKLNLRGERTYLHTLTKGYPTDVDTIVSDAGYGTNSYIETEKPLVVVTAPGPGSGKLATCLSQLYHEYKRGVDAGYAKFETFPVWNLPLKHPVNLAYEAATADLRDVNIIDPYHLDAYGVTTVNYNRDVEVFPVVKTILERITGGKCRYRSPTEMSVNMAGFHITDDSVVRAAAGQEIIRRYYRTQCDYKQGLVDHETAQKAELLMKELQLDTGCRPVVGPALAKAAEGTPAMAVELPDGRIVTGRTTALLNASASVMINSLKALSGIADDIYLLSPIVLEPILKLKTEVMHSDDGRLNLEEVLIALSISAPTNPIVAKTMSMLPLLKNCEAHSSVILPRTEEAIFRKCGVNLTCEPEFPTKELYYV